MSASSTLLDVDRLVLGLCGSPGASKRVVGRRLEYFPSIGSTNDRARELASSGEPEGTVVLSDEQTRGRGRASRTWHSPAGLGLYLSVLLRPATGAVEAPLAGLMAAVATCICLRRFALSGVHIKWPNDILVEDPDRPRRPRKIAGILTESRTAADEIRDVIIGIGVNVNQGVEDFAEDVAPNATSLRIATGREVAREDVALGLLDQMDEWYTLWSEAGPASVLEAFRVHAPGTRGRRVRISDGGDSWTGKTAGISDAGALLVEPDADPRHGGRGPVEIRFGEILRLEEA